MKFNKLKTTVKIMILAGAVIPNLASAIEVQFSRTVNGACEINTEGGQTKATFGINGQKPKDNTYVGFSVSSNTGTNAIRIDSMDYKGAILSAEESSRLMNDADFKVFVNEASEADAIAIAKAPGKTYSKTDGNYKLWLTTIHPDSKLKIGDQKVVMTVEAKCN